MFQFHSARLGHLCVCALASGGANRGGVAGACRGAGDRRSRIEQILFMARGGRDPDARHLWQAITTARQKGACHELPDPWGLQRHGRVGRWSPHLRPTATPLACLPALNATYRAWLWHG